MSTLAELASAHGSLTGRDLDHLHALVGEWQLLADLSFADLLLEVPTRDGGFVCVAQMRPTTGPTAHQDDEVGRVRGPGERHAVVRALREGRIVRDGEPEWRGAVPVREEAIPVRHAGRVIAVVVRDTNLAAARVPSQLELAYLRAAGELAQMVAEGSFPFPAPVGGALDTPTDVPRVGDGLLRVDPAGQVVFASPNALSAYRRLGLVGNLAGEPLARVHAELGVGEGPVARTLRTGAPFWADLENSAAEVVLRTIPLTSAGTLLGALVLVRDATELRRRERALQGKDAAIREIHHRVKNNLQTVAALLRLQARRTGVAEAREALEESVRRVTSIALVHETLSQTLDEEVPFDTIADSLAAMTVDVVRTGARARIRRSGSFGVLPGALATPLALVLSELLQNAVEHAFAGGGGELELRVRRSRDGLEVVVADDGEGLPAGFALEQSPRLGLQIVRTLVVGEMRGTLVLRPGRTRGTEAVVAVPAQALHRGPGRI